ncbi:hypothetical protein BN7_2748 [Wickerhamomyces ciferrii]|uniref:Internalin-I n=1 Tax=Wickerhamomyces ciferrii (strain ATCC 14091 / BCRC 22168 / CBS 111 / JCM 3599 / NBRC 0793 / NRRL Y-1031 F-60-10) TaxID=1206466 RepID=K0KJS1_WICCF|nr:uncharacterized protein BN7_2748 [Wickerhamomyces ciferrii]CCH43201.1 hypothetical protein BN7_2748 [Wickerhamomyces ciferrii]
MVSSAASLSKMTNILEMFPFEIKVLFLEQYLVETDDILNYLQVVPSMNSHFKANFRVVSDKINHTKYNMLPEGCLISHGNSNELANALREPQKFKGLVLMECHDYGNIAQFYLDNDLQNFLEAVHEQTIFRYTFYGSYRFSILPDAMLREFLDFDLNHRISHINFPDVEVLPSFHHLPNTKIAVNFRKLKEVKYMLSENFAQTFCFNIEYSRALESLSLVNLHEEFTLPKSFRFPKSLKLVSSASHPMDFKSQGLLKSQWIQNLEYLSLEDSRDRHPTTISMIDLNFPKLKEFKLGPWLNNGITFQNFTADSLIKFSICSSRTDVTINGFRAQNIENFEILANSFISKGFENITNLDYFKVDLQQPPMFYFDEDAKEYNDWSFLSMARNGSITRHQQILQWLEMVNLEQLELLEVNFVSLFFDKDNNARFPSLTTLHIDGYSHGAYAVFSKLDAPFNFNAPQLKFLHFGCELFFKNLYTYISQIFPKLAELSVSYKGNGSHSMKPGPLKINTTAVFENLESLKLKMCERPIILSKCGFPKLKTLQLINNGHPFKQLEFKKVIAPKLNELTIENYSISSVGPFTNRIYPKLKSIIIKNCQVTSGIEILPFRVLKNVDVKLVYSNIS